MKWRHLILTSILPLKISDYKLPSTHQMPTPLQQLNHFTMDESDVFKASIELNQSKAQGCDNISPNVLKYCSTSLASPTTKLFTTCPPRAIYLKNGKCIKFVPFLKEVISPTYQTFTLYLCFVLNCSLTQH